MLKTEESLKVSKVIVIINDKGLHTRPATELVKCACRYRSKFNLTYRGDTVDGRSLLGILALAAERGAKLRLEAEGDDAQELIDALSNLAANKFYINY